MHIIRMQGRLRKALHQAATLAPIAVPRVTSKDVARHAGVSQSAVSLVLSGKGEGRVAADKADRIRAAARELGYRPNAAARMLKTGSSSAVGLVVPDIRHPFFGQILRGAQLAARETRQAVVLVDAGYDADWQQESYELLQEAGAVDGFLWFSTVPPRPVRNAAPFVLVESELRGHSSVRFGQEIGAQQVGEHLRDLGHTRVLHLACDRRDQTFTRRERGIHEGLGFPPVAKVLTPLRVEDARRVARQHLPALKPTAIVADDDLAAVGALAAARDLGLRVPEELSIVGFDDLDIASVVHPALTTVRLDGLELGATAFRTLQEVLQDGRTRRRTVAPGALVVRGTTATAP